MQLTHLKNAAVSVVRDMEKSHTVAFAAALSYCFVLLDLLKKDLERLGPPATRLQARAGSFGAVCFLSPFVFEQAEQCTEH
jgi:hypothetical protein